MSEVPALKIKNLSKTYDNGFSALKGVDLKVPQGGFFALLHCFTSVYLFKFANSSRYLLN